jgi:fatty-acyl-CoA synthase
MRGIANQSDVLALEAQGRPPDLPSSTYEMILRGAALNPSAPALSFFSEYSRSPRTGALDLR